MRKKPYTAGEFFNEIIKDIPKPDIIEFARPSSKSALLTYYEFGIYTRVDYGSCEGTYASVYITGRYDIEPYAPDLCIGTIKTLNADDESVKKIYDYCYEIFIKGTKFLDENLDDFTWLGYRLEYPKSRIETSNEETIVRNIVKRIRYGYDISDLKVFNLATRKYENAEKYLKRAKEIAEEEGICQK